MNKQSNDKWLDELISRTINTEKPQFDNEKWKQKFPDEFGILQSRARKTRESFQWTGVLKSQYVKLAAAAVIILTIGFFIFHSTPDKKVEVTRETNVVKSTAEMLTLKSLAIAYRNGGIEAVEAQCDKAIEKLGSKSKNITIQELLTEINGV